MPEGFDSFLFDKGLNLRKDTEKLQDGELAICSGLSFEKDGYLTPLAPRVAKTHDTYGTIRNLHKYMNKIIMSEGSNIRYKWDLRDYCGLYTEANGNYTLAGNGYARRHRVIDYNGWTFMVNGYKNLAFLNGYMYDWALPNPTQTPVGAAGAGGNPNGTYYLYYTFVYYFPNGDVYESGPSAYSTVSVSSQKIEWTNIGVSPYVGEGVKIKRALYRYSTTLADIYYVASIGDNTTTTYSDNIADGTVQLNAIMTSDEFSQPPDDIVDIELYLFYLFAIKGTYLYWSEAYRPFNFKSTSAINFSDGDDLMGVVYWGDQLYIPTHSKWFRLYGSDPDTWAKKETYAETGINNTYTLKKTRYGILGSNYDGIYLFDGSTSRNMTLKQLGRDLFKSVYNHDTTWAEYDGLKYYYYYSTTQDEPDTCLVCDFTKYPDIIFSNDPFIPTTQEFCSVTKRKVYALGGITYEESATTGGSSIDCELKTGSKFGGNVYQKKQVKYVFWDMNTHGKDVVLTAYIDGTASSSTITINTDAREKGREEDVPFDWEGYIFDFDLKCSSVTDDDLEIYSPLTIEYVTSGK